MDLWKDILSIFSVLLNGLPQGLLALSFGFASVPTAFAFLIGAAGNAITGSVVPISFQAETITLAGTIGDNLKERLSMIFYGGLIMTFIGLFGLMSKITDSIGPVITAGMMAGVGIMLARVSIEMAKKNKIIGYISIASGVITHLFTKDLVYTIAVSVIISSIVYNIFGKKNGEFSIIEREKININKPSLSLKILRGAMSMVCLNIGANIAFGNITGQLANRKVNIDHVSVISSLADMSSSIFGGAPVESIISATGGAPNPKASGIIMMLLMAAILFAGLLPKIGKYIPTESIAGFLFVLGAIVTVPVNAASALTSTAANSTIIGGVTMTVTAITDPFIGMILGLLMKILLPMIG
ncbi:solute carrier family 23 protein [Clostridium botulinum]|uniref:Xanthine/uracil permease family protein n=1 Tax=Clostridium botulinum (strain Langeland / NCTC 10281 / Type F) TaxID=441772 RepID=A7GEX1_CLOBL|nr:solute carrier family 23 protein [Clostridium botulinum]ABS39572.1 xanthine/uracil permease family protein [Clostridium botulinum F str. Langeland]ADF99737.1 xanthine/uracil permease family protein [Clostridium botulinum F str. 230613]KKM42684.1 guanine permease [Clostridium botulinum]MBY6794036.1 NCS2 family permease [Clostridium botulinum]MBY6937035.1 NCS2 family permease [Clostridium botulinum]